jgi:hypothetical protein
MEDKENQIFDKYGNYDFPTEIKQEKLNTATTQIEEMAKIMRLHICKDRPCKECDCHGLGNKTSELYHCDCYYYAKSLVKQGYRRLPKDSVVLSMDNYNRLKRDSELYEARHEEKLKLFAKAYNQGSKETAEKFAKLIEFHSISKRDESGYETFTISNLCLREILREEFGFTSEEIETMWGIKE